jgi:hypothetical protein
MSKSFTPKKIWFLWLQGQNSMPYIVKNCYKSWVKKNPNYEVIFLNKENISQYINIEPFILNNKNITPQAFSDIVRVYLLNDYGGIWVDSTCFCTKPLDSWLNQKMTNDFFAFQTPGLDRPISSWFLAAKKNSQTIIKLKQYIKKYWKYAPVKSQSTPPFNNIKTLRKLSQSNSKKRSFTLLFAKAIFIDRISPYFWFHYLFAFLLKFNGEIRRNWIEQSSPSADLPHKLAHSGLLKDISPEIKNHIDKSISPLYKLNWRIKEVDIHEKSTLHYLLNNN